ncbi:MAG: helix-turn-helix transcriptional regulator [Labilithrix sp.]|nr:helix-turn-helix transcriptional regulator [Labilithrix sp.]
MDFARFRAAVGVNLKRARWLAGLTQEQVEGVTLRHYQEIERGRENPTLETLFGLANQFGVTVADLVNVPSARASKVLLIERSATAPKVGRKPRQAVSRTNRART